MIILQPTAHGTQKRVIGIGEVEGTRMTKNASGLKNMHHAT
jgi:hypothetical protein